MRLVDLSHTIYDGLVTYPGLPAPVVTEYMSREDSKQKYAAGTTFHIARIDAVSNTGTYLDVPFHRFENGEDLASFALEKTANLPGIVVDVRHGGREIPANVFAGLDLAGHAVLVHSGWSKHFGTPQYGRGHYFLSDGAAELLVRREIALLGIDSLNVDEIADGARPVHTRMLEAGISIVEHLTALDRVKSTQFRFFAVAPKWRGIGSFPVRAFALVE